MDTVSQPVNANAKVNRIFASVLLLFLLSYCTSDDELYKHCDLDTAAAGLYFGTQEPTYLGLTDSQTNAVVYLDLALGNSTFPGTCTGVLVASQWVLTAKHCSLGMPIASVLVSFGSDSEKPLATVTASVVESHPSLDLMLVKLETQPPAELVNVEPLVPLSREMGDRFLNGLAQVAGYGELEDGTIGERRFLVEPIIKIDADSITIDGSGKSGACIGDSGAPLLVRDVDGLPRVIGLLSTGSQNCVGIDIFTRLDIVDDWIESHTNTPEIAPATCGTLDFEGHCFSGVAVWCNNNSLSSEECSNNTVCGWSEESRGYRCVAPDLDSCEGVDNLGICDGDIALVCNAGSIEAMDCGECDRECRLSHHTGRADCVRDDLESTEDTE
ncbi:MAG: trypsin-like serine protease [Proteobacteria bacterium]|nr:trypsin-like serine protease [Pseudomonadota bacterium]